MLTAARSLAISTVLALAACGGSSAGPAAAAGAGAGTGDGGPAAATDAFAAATPDLAGLALETTGGAADGLPVSPGAVPATPAPTADAACQPWQFLCRLHAGVRELNAHLSAVLAPLEALAQTRPVAATGGARVYGSVDAPAAAPVATFRLTVKQQGAARFLWKLEGKPVGAADARYVIVLAGWLRPDGRPHRGAGGIAVDLDQLATLNPPGAPPVFPGAGQILGAFAHLGEAKSLLYAVRAFVPDATAPGARPLDAVFAGESSPGGEARVRLAALDDVLTPQGGAEPGSAARELLLSRGRWVPAVGGRAAVVITDTTGADVASYSSASPPFHVDYLLGVSCWDAAEAEGYHALFACRRLGAPACVPAALPGSWLRAGFDAALQDAAACRPGTELADAVDPPGIDPLDPAPEPGAAPVVADPADIPASLQSVVF